MKRDAAEILKDALALPTEARAALAGSLLDSLDTDVDEDAEAAWAAEVNRRVAELVSEAVKTMPMDPAKTVKECSAVGPGRSSAQRLEPIDDDVNIAWPGVFAEELHRQDTVTSAADQPVRQPVIPRHRG